MKWLSSGDGGGGTCHNDKPGQSKDKVLKVESRRVEVRGELEGGSGGTCHNDKPGRMMGMTMGGEGGTGERGRRVIVASRVVCLGKWKQEKERDGSNGKKGKKGVGGYR